MKIIIKIVPTLFLLFVLLWPVQVSAHCPLCTAGAGLAAVIASRLGVGAAPVGVFIGAFSVALGLWIARLIKRRYLPKQKELLVAGSFAGTVLPLLPLMREYSSVYISLAGDYGSLLNRTYLINRFLVGSIAGAALIIVAPYLSRQLSKLRSGGALPYQGLGISFVLLAVAAFLFELLW